jgi:hypothetical protein
MDQLHEIRVPDGLEPGQTFQITIAGALMSVTCPVGVRSGDVIQVRGGRAVGRRGILGAGRVMASGELSLGSRIVYK